MAAAVIVAGLLGVMSHGTFAGSGDEPHYLVIAHSLAFDGDLDMSNNYGEREPLVGGGLLQPEAHVRTGAGGVLRPVHDVGMPALFVPYVRVVRPLTEWLVSVTPDRVMARSRLTPGILYRHFIGLGTIAVTLLLALVLMRACAVAGASDRASAWTVAALCLSPPLQIFGILFFTEMLSALLIVFALVTLGFDSPPPRKRHALLAGAAVGLLPLVHIRNAPLAAAVGVAGVVLLWREASRRAVTTFGLAVAAGAAARALVNHHLWGTWVTTPHAGLGAWTGLWNLLTESATRLAGLLVDREYGLLPYAPIVLLALWGIRPLWRAQRRFVLLSGIAVAAYLAGILIPITNIHGWTGGWSPPARFLVPVLPLVAIPLALAWRVAPRPLAAGIVAVQVVISAFTWQHPKVLWNDGDGHAAICDRVAVVCRIVPSLVRPLGH